MGTLKLAGMRHAYDEVVADAVKRQHSAQRVVGDLLKAEIDEKQARSIRYQMTPASGREQSSLGRQAALVAARGDGRGPLLWTTGTTRKRTKRRGQYCTPIGGQSSAPFDRFT